MSSYKPYPKYKASGVEWLGEVPDGWALRPLKFFATFRGGATPSKDNVEFWNGDIPWVSPKDMKRARISDSIDHITEDAILQSSTSRIGPDCLLMVVRSGILQHTIPVAINDVAVTLNQDMRAIAPGRQCRTNFLYYWFVGNNAPLLLELGKQGATVESIEQEYLANTRILLPALAEQHQIASFLDRECGKLDALQAKQERLIELLKEKRQALISHAVTKGLPGVASAKTGLDPTAKLKPSGIEWLGEVPEHWVASKVKWVSVSVKTGGTPSDPSWFTEEPEVPWLTPGDFTEDLFKISPRRYVSQVAIAKREAPSFPPSSIFVIGIGATLGKVARLDERQPASSNQQINAIVPSKRIESDYLLFCLVAQMEQMKNCSNASTLGIMNQEKTKGLHIALPPLAEQRAIVAHLDEKCGKIDQLKAKAERGIELLKERRSALISAAVTGKIDVRDVDVCGQTHQNGVSE